MAKTRNYKKEYANYHAKPLQKVNRAGRNKARKIVMKTGGAAKAVGNDVHHKNGNPRDNRIGNLSVATKATNRSFARTRKAKKLVRTS
jgi:hypothetical protein|tara:strand:+ start:208 stop:471 length:264 start_codon:yes stop_codon:yes gene_type:complete